MDRPLRYGPWIVGLAVLAAYATALNSSFVWDDVLLVERNAYLRDAHYLGDILSKDLFRGAGLPSSTYRPVQGLTYFLEYKLFGLWAPPYHLTNALLHAGCAALLCSLLGLFVSTVTAAVAAGIWGLHPIHTEAVAYVSGRADSLAFGFMLASLIRFIRMRRKDPARVTPDGWSLAFFGLALFSRENGMVTPVLILLMDLACGFSLATGTPDSPPKGRFWMGIATRLAPYVGLLAVYGLLRGYGLELGDTRTTMHLTTGQRLLCAVAALGRYLAILALPIGLHMERSFPIPDGLGSLDVQAGALALLAIPIGIWLLRKRAPLAAAGIAWFTATWLPISGVFPLNALLAEHWMYVPFAGLVLAGAALVTRYPLQGKASFWAPTVALCVLWATTMVRNLDWRDPVTLFQSTIAQAPYSVRVRSNLGEAYADQGKFDDALREYQGALQAVEQAKLFPGEFGSPAVVGQVYANLTNVYRTKGDLNSAIAMGQQAVQLAPQIADGYINLGVTLLAANRVEDARKQFQNAIAVNPNSPAAYSNLGNTYFHENKFSEALAAYEQSIRLDPSLADAYNNRGSVLYKMGRTADALESYRQAAALKPDSPEIQRNLAVAMGGGGGSSQQPPAQTGTAAYYVNHGSELANAGRLDEAEKDYQKALHLDPKNTAALYDLGLIAKNRGDRSKARTYFKKALAADPNFGPANAELSKLP